MEAGIVSYGAYVPRRRIRPSEIGQIWGVDGAARGRSLGIESKSVPNIDEDSVTIAVTAARHALARCDVNAEDIGAIYVGSESPPYAVKPSSSIVGEAIGAAPHFTAADYEFACKAGTAGMQTALGLVKSGMVKYGLAIGSDTSQGAPGDALEYSASAGGAAYIIGTENVIARINDTYSYTTDTPDFWRREGQMYPSHGGRFTGEPAYFKHVGDCARNIMKKMGTTADDYDYAVFHQPNGKFPKKIARDLGFSPEKIKPGLMTPYIGNTYSGSAMIGLAATLDVSKPGDRILVVSYGSGAGSDGFDITVTDNMASFRKEKAPLMKHYLENVEYVNYSMYVKLRKKIHMPGGN